MGTARGGGRVRSSGTRTTVVASILLLVALVPAACSSSEGSDGRSAGIARSGSSTTSTTSASTPAVPERFTGDVDDFYVAPDPLPPGEPGDLIRIQAMSADEDQTSMRVMYRSTDQTGADRAVTGIVTYPAGEAPADGWPVISTAHGTTGIASPCAPSRSATAAPGWGVEGVWAMTDYVGLGPVGELHPYLSKAAEGNAVIDIVRAARQLPDAHAGTRWISIGHSQGGHGALSAHELAAERAPELELVATVALAPAAMVDRVYGGIDPIVTSILTMMSLVGGEGQYPGIELADYATPDAVAAAKVMETACLDEITEAMVPIALDGAFTADPRQTEPARSAILANDVGEVAVDGVPVFLASGTKDDRVVIERSRDLFARMCAAGQVTTFTVVDGADHGSILEFMAPGVKVFIEDALAGRPATDSCTTGEGTGFFFEL